MISYGKIVELKRKERGYSRSQLGKLCGCSDAMIFNIESKNKIPRNTLILDAINAQLGIGVLTNSYPEENIVVTQAHKNLAEIDLKVDGDVTTIRIKELNDLSRIDYESVGKHLKNMYVANLIQYLRRDDGKKS